ncbi:MAG: metallophosphoesterase [Acidobacteria bacterium]|nr:metallophosphoesterase [Acidobacteriota bacterium]
MRRAFLWLLLFSLSMAPSAQELTVPNKPDSVKFAVMGDTGTGSRKQRQVGEVMAKVRAMFPFDFVIMLGDNLYGGSKPADYQKRFELPYKALIDAGVTFYAALGNHDDPNERFYKLFNMDGKQYYTFARQNVRFFVLDSDYVDRDQLRWIEDELTASDDAWKIAYFHHPLYSSGRRHGLAAELRQVLEPLFVRHEVDVVFAGHEHFYERIKPQKGIYYFISGSGGQLRAGNIRSGTGLTAAGFDRDQSFMIVEIDGDDLYFQAIARTGRTVDSGVIHQPEHARLTSGAPDPDPQDNGALDGGGVSGQKSRAPLGCR